MPRVKGDLAETFLAAYPPAVAQLVLATRARVLAALPEVAETVDRPARRGSELADPDGLLEGSGKVHRHVRILAGDAPRPAAIARLLKAARAAWKRRQG